MSGTSRSTFTPRLGPNLTSPSAQAGRARVCSLARDVVVVLVSESSQASRDGGMRTPGPSRSTRRARVPMLVFKLHLCHPVSR